MAERTAEELKRLLQSPGLTRGAERKLRAELEQLATPGAEVVLAQPAPEVVQLPVVGETNQPKST